MCRRPAIPVPLAFKPFVQIVVVSQWVIVANYFVRNKYFIKMKSKFFFRFAWKTRCSRVCVCVCCSKTVGIKITQINPICFSAGERNFFSQLFYVIVLVLWVIRHWVRTAQVIAVSNWCKRRNKKVQNQNYVNLALHFFANLVLHCSRIKLILRLCCQCKNIVLEHWRCKMGMGILSKTATNFCSWYQISQIQMFEDLQKAVIIQI